MLPIYWMYHKKTLTRLLLLCSGFFVFALVITYSIMHLPKYQKEDVESIIATTLVILLIVEWLILLLCVIFDNNLFYKNNMNWLYHVPIDRGKFILHHLGMVLLQLFEITVLSVASFSILLIISSWMKFNPLDCILSSGCNIHLMYETPTTKEHCPALVLNNGIFRSYDYDEKSKQIVEYKWLTEKANDKILNKFNRPLNEGEGFIKLNRPMCNLITSNGGHVKQIPFSLNEILPDFLRDPLSNAKNLSLVIFLVAIILYNLLSFNGVVTNLKTISTSSVFRSKRLSKNYILVIGSFVFIGVGIFSFIVNFPFLGFILPLITGLIFYTLVLDYRTTWKIPININSKTGAPRSRGSRLIAIFIIILPSVFFFIFSYIHVKNPTVDAKNLLSEMAFLKSFTPKLTNEQIRKIIALKDIDGEDITLLKQHIPANIKFKLLTIFPANTSIDGLLDAIINKNDVSSSSRIIALFSNSLSDADRFTIFNKLNDLIKNKKYPPKTTDNSWDSKIFGRYYQSGSEVFNGLFPLKKYQREDIEKLLLSEDYDRVQDQGLRYAIYSSSPLYLANVITDNLGKIKSVRMSELVDTLSLLYLRKVSFNDLLSDKRSLLGNGITETDLENFCKGITANTIEKIIDSATDENVGMIYYCNNQLFINNISLNDRDDDDNVVPKKKYSAITRFTRLVFDAKKQKNVLPENIKMILIKNFKTSL
ncbi:MAG: hypothetical protein HQK51_09385 [Oligoflexia bacterium]|nr:hypothetical protein [Oligoflexia bacterium]